MSGCIFYVNNVNGGTTQVSGSSTSSSADLTGTAASITSGVVSLDGSPDLSGLTVDEDVIRLVGVAGGWGHASGQGAEFFRITAIDNTAKTVTVTPAPADTSGITWYIGGAFASIKDALYSVFAPSSLSATLNENSKIYVKKTGTTYTDNAFIYANQCAATSVTRKYPAQWVQLIGYETTLDDGVLVPWANTAGYAINFAASHQMCLVENFDFNGSNQAAYSGAGNYVHFHNCNFENTTVGLQAYNYWSYTNCEFDGVAFSFIGTFNKAMYCIFRDNTSAQLKKIPQYAYKCVFDMSTTVTDTWTTAVDQSNEAYFSDCTIIAKNYKQIFADLPLVLTNVLIDSDAPPTGEGLVGHNVGTWRNYRIWSNLFAINGSYNIWENDSQTDYAAFGLEPIELVQAASPGITDVANQDYSLAAGSACINPTTTRPVGLL